MMYARIAATLLFACTSGSLVLAQEKPDTSETECVFLKEAISITTESGVTSLVPGTPVTRCGETRNGTKVRTSSDLVIEVKESQLTFDRAESERLAQREALLQAEAHAETARVLEQQRIENQRRAELLNQASPVTPQSSNSGSSANSGLKQSPIQYEPVRANVVVHPPTFKKKKKKK